MIEVKVTQTVRVACDHCGGGVLEWHERINEARMHAEDAGFHFSVWTDGDCLRELCLCDVCHKKAVKAACATAAGKIMESHGRVPR